MIERRVKKENSQSMPNETKKNPLIREHRDKFRKGDVNQ